MSRLSGPPGAAAVTCNAHIDSASIRKHCALNDSAGSLLQRAMDHLGLSARAYDKILRLARTLADLESAENISETHIAEAIQYRSLDRKLY